jgi:hypothetical protein
MAENFTVSNFIDPATLRKAAECLLEIDVAGYGGQFDRELFERTDGDDGFRVRGAHSNARRRMGINPVTAFAKRLAKILDCPLYQAIAIAAELLGDAERREVAVGLLKEMSGQVRQLNAQAAHSRFTRRAS